MEDIKDWIKEGKQYETGLLLFKKHYPNHQQTKKIERVNNHANRSRLNHYLQIKLEKYAKAKYKEESERITTTTSTSKENTESKNNTKAERKEECTEKITNTTTSTTKKEMKEKKTTYQDSLLDEKLGVNEAMYKNMYRK